MRVLVLGGTGMLGHVVFRYVSGQPGAETFATVRSSSGRLALPEELRGAVLPGVDANDFDSILRALADVRPDVVVNCIGLVKLAPAAQDPLVVLALNSLFPHRLQRVCEAAGMRMIHISTDCVFSGDRGAYDETDTSDARDLYGRSKSLGEVDAPNAVTLRTSIIGPEAVPGYGLLEWFLGSSGAVRGFTRAIFSGLPTVELAAVIWEHVVPNLALRGVYHVASEPISKFDLISLCADVYGHPVEIVPDDTVAVDRSLNGTRFQQATGYRAPTWPEMVRAMRDFA
ncbi:MAG: dTDP-4-dehydrorhamnose reductase family protein [Longimicrobiales bacterium]